MAVVLHTDGVYTNGPFISDADGNTLSGDAGGGIYTAGAPAVPATSNVITPASAVQKDASGNVVGNAPFGTDNTDSAITTLPTQTQTPTNNSVPTSNNGKQTVGGEYVGNAYTPQVDGEYGLPVYDSNNVLKVNPVNRTDTVDAFINGYAVIRHAACKGTNDWRDISDEPGAFPKYTTMTSSNVGTGGRNPTLESILTDFGKNITSKSDPRYPTPYYATDFMYAKYFEYIPLNRLITLRRFPHPTWDSLAFPYDKKQGDTTGGTPRSFKPIAQAVTYFGDPTGNKIEDLTKINGLINWKQLEAEVNVYKGEMVAGLDQNPFAGKLGNFGRAVSVLTGKGDPSGRAEEEREYAAAYTTEDYLRKPYGPINSIVKTNIRDRGIEGNMKFTLTFEYQLRSYYGINPRLAFMDVYCNMLALVFHHAKFWGGANRYFPNNPQYAFLGDQKKYFDGDYEGFIKSFFADVGSGVQAGLDILKNVVNAISNMDFAGALKTLVKNVGGATFDEQAAKGRPHMIGFKALLNGDPTGEWHLTVGNPYRPILMVGNLIMKNFEFSMSGHLGVDDLPSEMKWVINLEQGMPRDSAGLQSIFNYGQGKMYYKPVESADAFSQGQTAGVDTSTSGGSQVGSNATPGQAATQPNLSRVAPADADFISKLGGTLW